MSDEKAPISLMPEVETLEPRYFFPIIDLDEPLRQNRNKRISGLTLQTIIDNSGGGGGGGSSDPISPRTAYFKGDGVTSRFTLPYTPVAPILCIIGSRALSFEDDYFFDGDDLVFYEAPNTPSIDYNNIVINFWENVGGISFLKANQGLDSVLKVDNVSAEPMILNSTLSVDRLIAQEIVSLPLSSTASRMIVDSGQGVLASMTLGAGFSIDAQNRTINIIGGGGGGVDVKLSTFDWTESTKGLRGQLSDGSFTPSVPLNGLALLSEVVPKTGGTFDGTVVLDNGGVVSESLNILGSLRLGLNGVIENGYAEEILSADQNFTYLKADGTTFLVGGNNDFEIRSNRIIWQQSIPSPRMMVLNPSGLVTLEPIQSGSAGDGNNYTSDIQFNNANGILTISRISLDDLTVDLDGRWLNLSGGTLTGTLITRGIRMQSGYNLELDYLQGAGVDRYIGVDNSGVVKYMPTPSGGGGVSGTSGRIPVFESGGDGVGDSLIRQLSGFIAVDGGITTSEPDGLGGFNTFQIGQVRTISGSTTPNRVVRFQLNGTMYELLAKSV